jgi:thiol-disulfide isomerase/thioredoxin
MKKQIIGILLGLSVFLTLSAKDKVIVNPVYEFKTSGINHIARIELTDNETRIHVRTTFIPGWWVMFSKGYFVEDCATGQKWYATDIEKGEFDKQISMPASGDSLFILIFPKLDKNIAKINFGEHENTEIFAISLNPKAKQQQRRNDIPHDIQAWIDEELAVSKRKTLMDFRAGEFFLDDSARLIGYIKGYDPRAGFSTGMVYTGNEITREDFPRVVQIHDDGRFECTIPMNYPKLLSVNFQNRPINFYVEPGITLVMVLDWEEFLTADRLRNIRYTFSNIEYRGGASSGNAELTRFYSQIAALPYNEIYNEMKVKNPDEYKIVLDKLLEKYTDACQKASNSGELSELTKVLIQNNYTITYAGFLLDYEMQYGFRPEKNKVPDTFFDFLQNVPMNNRNLVSTSNFSVFINRFEYCSPLSNVSREIYKLMQSEKSFEEYLFDELGLQKMPEDIIYLNMKDSLNIKLNQSGMTDEGKQKMIEEYTAAGKALVDRYGEDRQKEYQRKYVDAVETLTQQEIAVKQREMKDSVYSHVLKLNPGILYDITKVRELDFLFGRMMKGEKDEARRFLTMVEKKIQDPYLKKEAERIFLKNFPEGNFSANELPHTADANAFRKIIEPFGGKYLLVDFWAIWCSPCIASIKQLKPMREKYRDSKDVDFIFITAEDDSPLDKYNVFVKEQDLANSFRVSSDEYKYFRQLFKFNGIPKYIIVDREGKIISDEANAHDFERKLKEILDREK